MTAVAVDTAVDLSETPYGWGEFEAFYGHVNGSDARDILGVSERVLRRWRTIGLTDVEADQVATRLRTHPSAIWGDLWWDLAGLGPDHGLGGCCIQLELFDRTVGVGV